MIAMCDGLCAPLSSSSWNLSNLLRMAHIPREHWLPLEIANVSLSFLLQVLHVLFTSVVSLP
jgi:hypothetical protein